MSRRRLLLVACWLSTGGLLACSDLVRLNPPVRAGTRTIISIVETEQGRLLQAIDHEREPVRSLDIGNEGDLEVWILEYSASLEDLNLKPGPLTLDPDGTALPPPTEALRAEVRGQEASVFARIDPLPDSIGKLRIATTGALACLEGGGCLQARVPEVLACITPCPEPTPPAPPLPPEPPRFQPCPAAWATLPVEGVLACDPWSPGAAECPSGQARFLGRADCEPIGGPCDGPYSSRLPAGAAIRYVDPAAAAGGDGTQATPFATLSQAIATVPPSTVLALAAGRYLERVNLDHDLQLIGACAGGTVLAAPAIGQPSVRVSGGRVELWDLSIEADQGGIRADNAVLGLNGVEILGAAGTGIEAVSTRVDAQRVKIRGLNRGVYAELGDSVRLEALVLSQLGGDGIGSFNVAQLWTEDVSARQLGGTAFSVRGGHWQGARLAVEGAFLGINLADAATSSVSDLVLGGIESSAVWSQTGANFEGARLRIERFRQVALLVGGTEGTITAEDVLLRDALGNVSGLFGRGIEVASPGLVRVERGLFQRMRGQAVFARGRGTVAEVVDVVINQTQPVSNEFGAGTGLYAFDNGQIGAERVEVIGGYNHGVYMESGVLEATDLRIRDVHPRSTDGGIGRGVEVLAGTRVTATRLAIARTHNLGFYAFDGRTQATLRDLSITGTSTSVCIGFSCNAGVSDGLAVALSASVDVERFAIFDNGLYGVRFVNNESRLVMKDGRISGQGTGAQIVSGSYDLRNLAEGVLIIDNPIPLELLRAD